MIGTAIIAVMLLNYFKPIPMGNIVLTTGAIKSGKTTFSVHSVYKEWKRRHFLWWIKAKIFKQDIEEPLLYSNIPLGVPYVPITRDLLTHKSRFNYGSVAYLCETSLVADSQSFRDEELNEQLMLFVKLWAHNTHNGILFLDTQSLSDNHFAIKRCINNYLYIYNSRSIGPFILMDIMSSRYSYDENTTQDDYDGNIYHVLVSKKTWKLFDCWCYDTITKCAKRENILHIVNSQADLKAYDIVSFKCYKTVDFDKIKQDIMNSKKETENDDELKKE